MDDPGSCRTGEPANEDVLVREQPAARAPRLGRNELLAERVGGGVRRCIPSPPPTSAPTVGRACVRPDHELARAVRPRRELDLDWNRATSRLQGARRTRGCEVAAVERAGRVPPPLPIERAGRPGERDGRGDRGRERNRHGAGDGQLAPISEEVGGRPAGAERRGELVVHGPMIGERCYAGGTPRRREREAAMAVL
jgi:hypothetical protein